jgi:predicted dinucleotide-binding enzyme
MKIGIIGSGAVGQALAKAFIAEGHEVMIGTRNTSKEALVTFSKENKISLGILPEAAGFGELLVVCTKGDGAKNALSIAGVENLASKIIIDTTNPIAAIPPENCVLHFTTTLDRSLMEDLQQEFPDAKFVKAFNSVGNALMYKPDFAGIKPSMFICGNDEKAKETVTNILTSFGWETEDMGAVAAARAIEPLCILWCIPGFLKNQWGHAFKLLKP